MKISYLSFLKVMSDDDKVPGWEGQIVAWVEEDTG
jgi:hypothetical protein